MVIDKALIKQIYLENNSKFFDNKLQTTRLEFRIDHSVNNFVDVILFIKRINYI